MAHLLDKIKKRIGNEEEEDDTFEDMHYIVGNTTGLNIGQVPGPIDQRIGRMAQIGGETLEILITNPATFKLDRPEVMNVIEQLDFEKVTLHGDPNIGFTSSYATTGRSGAGYNIVHRYFKSYLEHMASFGHQAVQEDRFKLGYVNMHASNDSLPPREEQMARDTSFDPMGNRITNFKKEDIEEEVENIYENKDFLELLFDFFVKEYLQDQLVIQLYTNYFTNHSDKFEDEWFKERNDVLNEKSEELNKDQRKQIAAKTSSETPLLKEELQDEIEDELSSIEPHIDANINMFIRQNSLPGIIETIFRVAEDEDLDLERSKEELYDEAFEVWKSMSDESPELYNAKVTAVSEQNNHISRLDIEEKAAENIDEIARKTFAGREEYYTEEEIESADGQPQLDLVEEVCMQGGRERLSRQIDKESTIFYNIMPAWMQAKDVGTAPRFIWDTIVETNNEEDENLEDFNTYQEYLERERNNELDIIAAVGCCYIWGHYTQKKDKFKKETFRTMLDRTEIDLPNFYDNEEEERDTKQFTWLEWLDKFNLKINIEAMYGSPGDLKRVWRPKDIAVVCHAIDLEARKQLENYDDGTDYLVKFTIDMEHTASYGVDPWLEMEKLIENEKKIVDYSDKHDLKIDIDREKPLAKVVKTYHLTKPGWEQQSGHRHGPFARGDETLYQWLYKMVEAGFTRNEDDEAIVMFEVGGEYREEMYVIRVALDMIRRGIKPTDLNPEDIPLEGEYENTNQALMARFFGLDKAQFNSEMTKIEEHAFDPLDNLLEAEQFDHTYSGRGYLDQGGRPGEWMQEEYR